VDKSGGCFLIVRIQRDCRGRGVLLFVCVRGGIILMVLDMQLFTGMDSEADCILGSWETDQPPTIGNAAVAMGRALLSCAISLSDGT
jgi:hypothetical protein